MMHSRTSWLVLTLGLALGGDLLLFPPGADRSAFAQFRGAVDTATAGTGGLYVDDSPAATETFDRARGLISQKRYIEAIGLLQRLSTEFDGRLIGTGPNRYGDIRLQVQEMLRENAELLKAYQLEAEPQAQRLLDEARVDENTQQKLQFVVDRYWLTRPGLQAALDLAAFQITHARFAKAAAAITLAQTHPDADQARSRILALRLALARLVSDKETLDRLLIEARDLPDAGVALTGSKWNVLPVQESLTSNGTQDESDFEKLPLLADLEKFDMTSALWEFPLRQAFLGEPELAVLAGNQNIPLKDYRLPFVVDPRVQDGAVILNTGFRVIALDLLSGREIWNYQAVQLNIADMNQMHMLRPTQSTPESRSVAVDKGRVLAVVGGSAFSAHTMSLIGRSSSALVCIELATGKLLWRADIPRNDPKLSMTLMGGTPTVIDGVAYVTLYRPAIMGYSGTGQSELYIAAYSVENGELLWTRYLVSSNSPIRPHPSIPPTLTKVESDIVVTDPAGAIARLDSRSGSIRWLTTLAGGKAANVRLSQGELQGIEQPSSEFLPARIPAGIAARFQTFDTLQLFDPRTGNPVETNNDLRVTLSDSLAQVGDNFILSGTSAQLIDGGTLKRRWVSPLPVRSNEPNGMSGVPLIIQDAAIVPVGSELICINLETGKTMSRKQIPSPGQFWFNGQQAMLTDRETLRFFMPWAAAVAQIRKRATTDPDDPRTGMSLAYLGLRKQDSQITREGLDLIVKTGEALKAGKAAPAVNQDPLRPQADNPLGAKPANSQSDVRAQSLVDFLLSFSGPQTNPDAALRKSVLDTLAKVVQTPRQEVEYRLSLIEYLKQTDQASAAVAQLQLILSDPSLSSQNVTRGSTGQRADLIARAWLGGLIEKYGPEIYASYNDQAKRLLQAETSSGRPESDACLRIAEQYPFADSTPRALYFAGMGKASAEPQVAMRLLARAYLQARQPQDIQDIIGELVEINLRLNQNTRAIGWLRRAQREHPDLAVMRQGLKVQPQEWISQLQKATSDFKAGATDVRQMAQPVYFNNHDLLEPIRSIERETISNRYIVGKSQSRLMIYDPVTLERKSEMMIPGASGPAQVVFQDDDKLAIWMPQVRRLVFFNVSADLKLSQGPGLNLNQVLESVGNEQTRNDQLRPEERAIMGQLNPIGGRVWVNGRLMDRDTAVRMTPNLELIGVNDAVVVIADNAGRVCAVDKSTGEIAWKQLLAMEMLETLYVSHDAIVLKGPLERFANPQTSVISVLDPLTGEPRIPNIEAVDQVPWAGVTSDGYLAYFSDDNIVSRAIRPNSPISRTAVSKLAKRAFFSQASNTVLVQENDATLAVFDPAAGEITGRVSVRPVGETDPFDVIPLGQGWLAWGTGFMVATDKAGKPLWRAHDDMVAPEWRGVRVVDGQVVTIRSAEPSDIRINTPMSPMLIGPNTGSRTTSVLNGRVSYTLGKVSPDGQQELRFEAQVLVDPLTQRWVWLRGVAPGHVSSSNLDKQEKVAEQVLVLAKEHAELKALIKAGADGKPTNLTLGFVPRSAPFNAPTGLHYEVLSYEAGTGRLIARKLIGHMQDQIEPSSWRLMHGRLFVDKVRPVSPAANQMWLNRGRVWVD